MKVRLADAPGAACGAARYEAALVEHGRRASRYHPRMGANRVMDGHVEVTPGIAGGRPRIAGHRIRVQDVVVWHEFLGISADEIVVRNPGLRLADVYAALAYYHDHRAEIRRQLDEEGALVTSLKRQIRSKLAP